MEAIWTALIAMGSAIVVKVLDWALARRSEKRGAIAQLSRKVDSIGSKLDAHIKEDQETKAIAARNRILRADDEILHGVKHSHDFFRSLLLDITAYEQYSQTHPDFPNEVTRSAEDNIRRVYEKCKRENSFL